MIYLADPKVLIGKHTDYRMFLWSRNLDRLDEYSVSINFNPRISFFDTTLTGYNDCNMQLKPEVIASLTRMGIPFSTFVVHSHFVGEHPSQNKLWYYSEVHNILQLTSAHDIAILRLMFF